MSHLTILLLLFSGSIPIICRAQQSSLSNGGPVIRYGSKGFELQSADSLYLLQIQSRLQFRFATPGDQDPLNFEDFNEEKKRIFKVNRARLKVGGHAFTPWLKYYWEYELGQGNLLDFRIMLERWKGFRVKIGQWKVDYSRERVISSGRQQMMERSIVNRPFTLDRQQGVCLYGHLEGRGLADFNYWVSVLTGNGRSARTSDDAHLMYEGRFQWNFLGREMLMQGSDTKYQEQAIGSLALAAATNRSPYTRFSQAGGGQLEGFEEGLPGQYRMNQWVEETAFMYRGFSWQQEFHWKQIRNLFDGKTTTLVGQYAQAGYFFHHWLDWVPAPLETAFRYAVYRPDIDLPDNWQHEFSLAFNWFFKEHLNKLTMDVSYFEFQEESLEQVDGFRFRLQWDISL